MLNNLENYCNSLTLEIYKSVEGCIGYKGTIDDKNFTLNLEEKEVKICTSDDLLFSALCAILRAKYKTLLTQKRNVKLLGQVRSYNLVQFSCMKKTKIKIILGQVERLYYELKKEKYERGN